MNRRDIFKAAAGLAVAAALPRQRFVDGLLTGGAVRRATHSHYVRGASPHQISGRKFSGKATHSLAGPGPLVFRGHTFEHRFRMHVARGGRLEFIGCTFRDGVDTPGAGTVRFDGCHFG